MIFLTKQLKYLNCMFSCQKSGWYCSYIVALNNLHCLTGVLCGADKWGFGERGVGGCSFGIVLTPCIYFDCAASWTNFGLLALLVRYWFPTSLHVTLCCFVLVTMYLSALVFCPFESLEVSSNFKAVKEINAFSSSFPLVSHLTVIFRFHIFIAFYFSKVVYYFCKAFGRER